LAEIRLGAPAETRRLMRWTMAIFYGLAGILHLATPDPFLAITPDLVPAPHAVILLTGLCEIAGAAALLTRRLRWWAGAMLALYAVCVFPANIKHAFENLEVAGDGELVVSRASIGVSAGFSLVGVVRRRDY
jgi:uncharacterized membrane protein